MAGDWEQTKPAPSDPGDKSAVVHRAGYAGNPLGWAEYWSRKGGTLYAGEGALLVAEIDRLRARVRELETGPLLSRAVTPRLVLDVALDASKAPRGMA